MNFSDYQKLIVETAYWNKRATQISPLAYSTLKLNGEAGEVAEKIGKMYRDADGYLSEQRRLDIALELGDVLWYLTAIAMLVGYTLEEIAQMNTDKLADRAARGVLGGEGDNR